MSESNSEVVEAVMTASDYCKKLEKAIDNVVDEFKNGRKSDTDEYAKMILDGINWVIQVYNSTKDYLKEIGSNIDESAVNESIKQLAAAYQSNDDEAKADALAGGIRDFIGEIALAGGRIN